VTLVRTALNYLSITKILYYIQSLTEIPDRLVSHLDLGHELYESNYL
jgi:hypothetical protein